MCPANCPSHAFYLQPLSKPADGCWFSCVPVGDSQHDKIVKQMCESVGIHGFLTNYLLRSTAATRLYKKGAYEQQIMERTGHQSTKVLVELGATRGQLQDNVKKCQIRC